MFKNFNEYEDKKNSGIKIWLSVLGVTIAALVAQSLFVIFILMIKIVSGNITAQNFEQASMDMSLNLFSTVMIIITIMIASLLLQKQKKESIGIVISTESVIQYIFGTIIGLAMFSVCLIPAYMTGTITTVKHSINFSTYVLLFIYAIGYMIQSFSEELLCRGYILKQYSKRYNIWFAIFAQALIFAILHLANSGITVLAFINIVLFGVLFGFLVILTNNVMLASAVHFMWNYAQGCIYGLSVSGTNKTISFLESQVVAMNSMWTGGVFGVEASISVTIVELVVITICLPKVIKTIKQKSSKTKTN